MRRHRDRKAGRHSPFQSEKASAKNNNELYFSDMSLIYRNASLS